MGSNRVAASSDFAVNRSSQDADNITTKLRFRQLADETVLLQDTHPLCSLSKVIFRKCAFLSGPY